MRIYISGPMTGLPDDNFPAFADAADRLRRLGHVPLNPAEGSKPVSNGGRNFNETAEYGRILRRAVKLLCDAEGICMLPGWDDSSGATLEWELARRFHMLCAGLVEWEAGYAHTPAGERVWLNTAGIVRGIPIPAVSGGGPGPALRWTGNPACEPQRGFEGDAGFDLVVAERVQIWPGEFYDVPLGISVELPPDTWGMLTGRSSTLRKRRILVAQGIIDQGYRGELFAGCQNMGASRVDLQPGERIAQLIPIGLQAPSMTVERVDELGASDRGTAGFGSTGL